MNNTSAHFQSLLTHVIQKLCLIFGPDITYARLSHIPELKLNSEGKILTIVGIDDDIIAKITTSFMALSPVITKQHIVPLFTSATDSLPAAQTHQAEHQSTQLHQQDTNQTEKVFI